MKKQKIDKGIWQVTRMVIVLLLVGSGAGLLWSHMTPVERTEEYAVYTYSHEAMVDYQVHLLPSELLPETVVGSGRAYITGQTEGISTEFVYRVTGDDKVKITGEYSVIATLTATSGRENHIVWEKTDELLSPQRFTANDSMVTVRESIVIQIAEYLEFANLVREETSFNPDNLTLEVKYDVNLKAETNSSVIRDRLIPTMVIPLRGNTFVVEGTLDEKKTDSVKDVMTVPLPQIETARRGFTVAATFMVVLLLTFSLTTVPRYQAVNLQEKEVQGILKKNQDRIVVSAGQVTSVPEKVIVVNTFDDLVKTADELGRPIIYFKTDMEKGSRHAFSVLTKEHDYLYFLDVIPISATITDDTRAKWRVSQERRTG
jgi:hypothetical protein